MSVYEFLWPTSVFKKTYLFTGSFVAQITSSIMLYADLEQSVMYILSQILIYFKKGIVPPNILSLFSKT